MRLTRIEKTIVAAALSAAAVLVGTPDAKAEAPAGEYVVVIAPEPPVMLARGAAQMCQSEPQGEICVSTTAITGLYNHVSGSAIVTLTGEIEGMINLTLGGALRGTTKKPTVHLEAVGRGELSDGSITVDVEGVGKPGCRLSEPEENRFSCKTRLGVCQVIGSRRAGCTRIAFPMAIAAEPAAPMYVYLSFDTDASGEISGSAEVWEGERGMLPPNESNWTPLVVKRGKYKPETDRSKVLLRGWGAQPANKLALKNAVFEAGTLTGGEIIFNLAGQKGRHTIAP